MKRWLTFIFLLFTVSALAHAPAPSVSGLDLSGGFAGAGGIGGLLARTDAEGSTFYHHDGAGNVTGLMDAQENMAARYLYGPFGKVLGQWGPMAEANRYQFSSKETEALSGLSYYGYRLYDPGLQRWLNPDPLGEAGGLNLYGFVGNNPLSQIDPDGLLFRELFEQMGSGLVNLMMGPEPGRYNQMTQGAMIANELGGIDRNDNPLSGSIQEAVALLGDAATDQAAGYVGGKLLGAALGAVCKKLPKFPWQKVGPAAATDLKFAGKGIGDGPGAMTRLRYEANPKHGSLQRGAASPTPRTGQGALDGSVGFSPNSTGRVGLDADGVPVVFRQHTDGVFHGYRVQFEDLTAAQKNALIENGFVNRKGVPLP